MNQNRQVYVLCIAFGVLAVLLSTCVGAFAGGVAGCWTAQQATLRVTEQYLQDRPQEWRRPALPERSQPSPADPRSLGPPTMGALVADVVENSPADKAGIQPGDSILAVDGVRVDQEHPLDTIIHNRRPGDRAEITLWSSGRERSVTVRLATHPDDNGAAYLGVYFQMMPGGLLPHDVD